MTIEKALKLLSNPEAWVGRDQLLEAGRVVAEEYKTVVNVLAAQREVLNERSN